MKKNEIRYLGGLLKVMGVRPLRRNNDLVVQEAKEEILVYDLKINRAYCLNKTSALIWQLCDGNNSVGEIKDKMNRKFKLSVNEDLIWLALDELKKDDLMENGDEIENRFAGMTRREVIRKVGFASLVTLPMITSLIAPSAVEAQSAAPIVNCRRVIPGGVCVEKDCNVGSCSGFGCVIVDQPAALCCSGTTYAVITNNSPGRFDVSYFCR